jgi:uncharacterized protein YndB with AHSA1/START domain
MTSKVFLALRVPADPMRAFKVFTQEIASWWQPSGLFRVSDTGDGRLAFEPGEGGRLLTTFEDGSTFEIGRISVWEPGKRLVFAWRQANFSAEQSTEVEVCFEPVARKHGYRLNTAPGTRFRGGMLRGMGSPKRLRCSGRRIGGATRCMHSRNASPAATMRASIHSIRAYKLTRSSVRLAR